jgi:outer membrane protein OmpA-like peptidoglycan-associated protein
MSKQILLIISLLALIPGCMFRSKQSEKRPVTQREIMTDVDIPVAQANSIPSFDEDLDELALADTPLAVPLEEEALYAWVDQRSDQELGLKEVYFGYDEHIIRSSEQKSVTHDVARMRELLAEAEGSGKNIQFVINGNSDTIHGEAHIYDMYNRVKSEQRAVALKKQAVAAGIPADKIKVIGRGDDMPAIINGKVCTGDIAQQAPNRRDEIQVITI